METLAKAQELNAAASRMIESVIAARTAFDLGDADKEVEKHFDLYERDIKILVKHATDYIRDYVEEYETPADV